MTQPIEPIERIPLPEVYEVPWIVDGGGDDFSGTGSAEDSTL